MPLDHGLGRPLRDLTPAEEHGAILVLVGSDDLQLLRWRCDLAAWTIDYEGSITTACMQEAFPLAQWQRIVLPAAWRRWLLSEDTA